jgi:PAS domain-containing protein
MGLVWSIDHHAEAKAVQVPHTAPDRSHCIFKRTAWLDPWLTLIPHRGKGGSLAWRRAAGAEPYLAAVAFVVVATALRVAVDPYIFGAQFFTFCLAVIFSTFVGGGCGGLLAVVLSTLSAWYFLLPPYSFTLVEGEAPALVAFTVVGCLVVYIIASMQLAAVVIADSRAHVAMLEERVHAADELRRWHDMFQHLAIGVALNDPASNTLFLVNPAAAAMLGYSTNEIIGMSVFEVYAPTDRQRVQELKGVVDRDGHYCRRSYPIWSWWRTMPASLRQPPRRWIPPCGLPCMAPN